MVRLERLCRSKDSRVVQVLASLGGEYDVVAAARHSENLEPMVVYKPLYADRGWWVRPLGMFLEDVEVDGQRQPRFAYLGPTTGSR